VNVIEKLYNMCIELQPELQGLTSLLARKPEASKNEVGLVKCHV